MAEATAAGLRLVVTSHDRMLLDLECDEVTLPGREGDFGVLPGHAPLIATLRPGVLAYAGRAVSGVGRAVSGRAAVSSGFCQVYSDRVTVLADRAWLPDEGDATEANEQVRELAAGLDDAPSEELEALRDRIAEAQARAAL